MTTEPLYCPGILIAGIGNIFLGDDAFGVEVAQKLLQRPQPNGVRVKDFGIRGLDLAYALLDRHDAVVLVDAAPRGGQPGTLYVLEPEWDSSSPMPEEAPSMEGHNLDPVRVLRLAAALGGPVQRLILVGCEPGPPCQDEERLIEMSVPVRTAVDEAVLLVEALVARLLRAGNAIEAVERCETNTITEKEIPKWHPTQQTV